MDKELRIDIIGDASKLTKAMGDAGGQIGKFAEKIGNIGKTMTIVGGAVTAALGIIVKKTMDTGDQFDKMSLRTGESVENLSSLAYACDISGTSIEGMEVGIKFLTKGMDDASKGIGLAKDAFEYLGMSAKDTEGNLRPTIEVMKEAATKIAAIENPAKQAALAMDLFGARSGTQLLPLLKMGGAGIEELMEKAKELNIEISTKSAKAAADFKDELTNLKGSLAGAGRGIGDILIPMLTGLAKKATEIVKKITEWADAHKPLVELIVKVGATLGVLAAVGGPILIAVSAFMKMKVAITAVSVAAKALAISSGPIGWLILAAGALYLAWETNFGGIRDFTLAVVNKVKEALGWLWDKVKWVLEKLGLYKEKTEEIITSTNGLATATEETGKKADEASTGVDNLSDSMGKLGEGIETTKEKLNEFGQVIETFDEWVARLAEESEEANKKMAEAAEDAYKNYTDAMQPVEDRLYTLSHTEEEVAARALALKREQAEGAIRAAELSAEAEKEELSKVREWYEAEIAIIIATLEEKKQKEIEVAKTTEETAAVQERAIYGIREEWDELIAKVGEYQSALKKAASEAFLAGVPTIEETGYVPSYIPKLGTGTPLVTKTGLAVIDKGEAVLTPEQNKAYNQQKREINININNPVVRDDSDITKIKQQVNMAFQEFVRQLGRSGYELPV